MRPGRRTFATHYPTVDREARAGEWSKGFADLPPACADSVARFSRLLLESPIELGECGEVVASDPGLTALVLHLGAELDHSIPEGQRFALTDYIVTCGRDLLLATCDQIDALDESGSIVHVRQHSLLTAYMARALAPEMNVDPSTAYVAGLLHDLGGFVLRGQIPTLDPHSALYARVGVECARQWRLPRFVIEAMSVSAGREQGSGNRLVDVVRCACECSQVRLANAETTRSQLVC